MSQSLPNRFVIVGPPAMGKSTLLRILPSVLCNSTCIDLENTGAPRDKLFQKQLAGRLISGYWSGPLVLANAGSDSIAIAGLGYRVIGLHHPNEQRYLRRMEERDRERNSVSQGNHWEYHRKLFLETMPSMGINPMIVDKLAPEFDGKAKETALSIASTLQLEIYSTLSA